MHDGNGRLPDCQRTSSLRCQPRLLVLLLIAVTLTAGFLFINSPLFMVGAVSVEGNSYISDEDVFRIAGIPEQINIFRLNTQDIRSRLVGDLRIANVEVSRKFPATVMIHITERKPLAYLATNYGFAQVDKQGIVLAAFKNLRQVIVPIITGVRLTNEYVGDQLQSGPIISILAYLEKLDEATLNQLSEVNVHADGQLVAYTIHSVQIRLGGPERLEEKAKLTNDILQEINRKKLAVDYIDLNYTAPIIRARQ
jgi:cell division protein FtsQ